VVARQRGTRRDPGGLWAGGFSDPLRPSQNAPPSRCASRVPPPRSKGRFTLSGRVAPQGPAAQQMVRTRRLRCLRNGRACSTARIIAEPVPFRIRPTGTPKNYGGGARRDSHVCAPRPGAREVDESRHRHPGGGRKSALSAPGQPARGLRIRARRLSSQGVNAVLPVRVGRTPVRLVDLGRFLCRHCQRRGAGRRRNVD